jgi:hypothetical protein
LPETWYKPHTIKKLLFQGQVFFQFHSVSRIGEKIGQRDSEQPMPVGFYLIGVRMSNTLFL